MAAADGVAAWPPPLVPGSVAARWRSRLGLAAACLGLASLWFLLTGVAAADIGSRACGESCPVVVAVAAKVAIAAAVSLALLCPLAALLLAVRVPGRDCDMGAAEKESPPTPRSLAAAVREFLGDVLMLATCVVVTFSVLLVVGVLVKRHSPVKGLPRERIGSVIIIDSVLYFGTIVSLVNL